MNLVSMGNAIVDAWWMGMSRAIVPGMIAVIGFLAIDLLFREMRPAYRSWMWRVFYLKIAFALLVPFSLWNFSVPSLSDQEASDHATIGSGHSDELIANRYLAATVKDKHDTERTGFAGMTGSSFSARNGVAANRLSTAKTSKKPSDANLAWGLALLVDHGRTIQIGLFGIWIVGVSLVIGYQVRAYRRLLQQIRKHTVQSDTRMSAIYRQTALDLGKTRKPTLRLVDIPCSPCIVWDGRLMVVMPVDFEKQYGTEACRMAMAHELAHDSRRDLSWNLLANSVSTALFFLPLIWMAGRRYRMSYESACDAIAIDRGRVDRSRYANLLVRLLETRDRLVSTPNLVAMAGSESFRTLSARLNAMKRLNTSRSWVRPVAYGTVWMMIAAMLLPWGLADDKEEKKARKAKRRLETTTQSSSADARPLQSSTTTGEATATFSASAGGGSFGSSNGSSGGFSSGGGDGYGGGSSGGSGFGMASGSGSASVSIGGPRREESRASAGQPGITIRSSGTSTNNNNLTTSSDANVTQDLNVVDGECVSRTNIATKTHEVTIRESSDDGIEVRIRERKKGRKSELVYDAESREALEKEHPEAYEWVKKYAQKTKFVIDRTSGTTSNLSIVDGAGGSAAGTQVEGTIDVHGGVNPAQKLMQDSLRRIMEESTDPQAKKAIAELLDRMDQ